MYNIEVSSFYPDNLKYNMSRFMRYDQVDGIYDILDSEFIRAIRYLPSAGTRTVTFEEGKPSLICELIYGYFNWQYWWILMEYNNLMGPEDLVAGLQISYPSVSSMDKLFGLMNPKNN